MMWRHNPACPHANCPAGKPCNVECAHPAECHVCPREVGSFGQNNDQADGAVHGRSKENLS